jgi:hypothetical protein
VPLSEGIRDDGTPRNGTVRHRLPRSEDRVHRTRPPTLSIGLARQFINKVAPTEAYTHELVQAIWLPHSYDLQWNKRNARERIGPVLLSRWQAYHNPYRLNFDHSRQGKFMSISETRLGTNSFRRPQWGEDAGWEPSLCVVTHHVECKTASLRSLPHAFVSLHALARFVERIGRPISDQLFIENLRPLAECADIPFADDRIPCPLGHWIGIDEVHNANGRMYRGKSVRTFVTT